MIVIIKLIHTAIWAVMAAAVLYILYAGVMGIQGVWLVASIALIVLETIVLLVNGWVCPLTPIARRHSTDQKDNFDIFLPNWLARHNKTIFGLLFAIGLILTVFNLAFGR